VFRREEAWSSFFYTVCLVVEWVGRIKVNEGNFKREYVNTDVFTFDVSMHPSILMEVHHSSPGMDQNVRLGNLKHVCANQLFESELECPHLKPYHRLGSYNLD
jgi:hypothetical protein